MIITKLRGGLGNQMFQYAYGRYLANKHNTELFLDLNYLKDRKPRPFFTFRDYELDCFNHSGKIATENELKILDEKQNIIKESSYSFNQKYLEIKDNKYLHGYWQTEKYFKNIRKILLTDFTFKEQITKHLENAFHEIEKTNSVCIHVRYGYLNNIRDKYLHGFLGIKYLNKSINLISKKINNPKFYVFSDNVDWCKENLDPNYKIEFLENEFKGEDNRTYFRLMTRCKHFIISNSSFSWWAAWLAQNSDKIVIAPKRWFRFSLNNTKDLIPEGWIRL